MPFQRLQAGGIGLISCESKRSGLTTGG